MVKNLPAMWETWIQPMGWEDILEKGMATYSSIVWRIPMNIEAWWAPSMESQSQTRLSNQYLCIKKGKKEVTKWGDMLINLTEVGIFPAMQQMQEMQV